MTQAVERIVGRFALVEVIGGSGLAEVYRARDTRNGSEVAVKRLRAYFGNEKGLVDDYYRELERVQRLRHPASSRPWRWGRTKRASGSPSPSSPGQTWRSPERELPSPSVRS